MDSHLFQDTVPIGELVEHGPQNARRNSFLIQCSIWLGGPHENFPQTSFSNYLNLRHWDKVRLLSGDWTNAHESNLGKSYEECAFNCIRVLQSWLTLGFLESILGERVTVAKYTRVMDRETFDVNMIDSDETLGQYLDPLFSNGSISYFHTKHLVSNLVARQFKLIQMHRNIEFRDHPVMPALANFPIEEQQFHEIKDAFFEMQRALDCLALPRFATAISPANRLLANILVFPTLIADSALVHMPPNQVTLDQVWSEPLLSQVQLIQLVSQNNWCPFTLRKLLDATNYAVFYWLWASDFHGLSAQSHQECSRELCKAYDIKNPETYRAVHLPSCDETCGQFVPRFEDVSQILSAGNIPLIRATAEDDSGEYDIQIQAFDKVTKSPPFIAISHVWADGHGSSTEIGLPKCQMKFLIEACKGIPDCDSEVVFWIDSICIPNTNPNPGEDLRKSAIKQMAEIYESSKAVLVLDSTLMNCSINASHELLLLRIYTAPWMNRVWTYQEAALANELYFKLRDDTLHFQISTDDWDLTGPIQIAPILTLMRDIYNALRNEVQNLTSSISPINISKVGQELRWRRTSRRHDEIVATAILLDLDVGKIYEQRHDPEKLMATFLMMVRFLPKNLIFMETDRLHLEGFRWAPTTFTGSDSRRLFNDLENRAAVCSRLGLFAEYLVFTPLQDQIVTLNPSQRLTILDDSLSPPVWFDVSTTRNNTPITQFANIILLTEEYPRSVFGAAEVAATVLSDDCGKDIRTAVRKRHGRVELFCCFQTIITLARYRHVLSPPSTEDVGVIQGRFKKRKVLFR